MYYDPNKTLSKQRLFNFVIGARGCGKTYGSKKTVIRRFLTTQKQFVYIRRYETELPSAEMRNFFDDIADEFPNCEFKSGRGLFLINNEVAGWYIALSKATMLKSVPFPNVGLIIFDEFIIETGVHHYLPNEVRTFLECYSTISRDRDVPVLFLSNAITMTNPYFLYFDIHFEENQTTKLLEDISVELIQSQEYQDHVNSTRFGRLIRGTEYGNYHTANKFLLDTPEFIESLPAESQFLCTFIFNGNRCGFYQSALTNRVYIAENYDATSKKTYALEFNEHDPDTILAMRSNIYVQLMLSSYCEGNLRFTTQGVKNKSISILRRLL